MRKRKPKIILLLIAMNVVLGLCACGKASEMSTASSEELENHADVSVADANIKEEANTESQEPAELYKDALEKISSGQTQEGMAMLAEIPSYNDAELYLIGYSYLEYFIGEWEADLENDFEKGITAYPYEMTFIISDAGVWLDSETNGFQRLRFPVSVDYTIWKGSKTETGKEEYEGYLLFNAKGDNSSWDDVILFGLDKGGIWYNFYGGSADRAKCSFSISDASGDIDTKANNTFYCKRITEQQKSNITWVKPAASLTDNSNGGTTNSSDVYTGDNQALAKALSYLAVSSFSRQGLIEQLEYEGFSHSEAEAAVDNCGANWKEQAASKALSYLDYSAFSYTGLIEQLEYEGFSSDEAKYGADNCGADWNEQAAKKAKQYLEYSSFSRSELIDQLIFEGFTQSQAEYGANRAY